MTKRLEHKRLLASPLYVHSDTPRSFFENCTQRGDARKTLIQLEKDARRLIRKARDPLLRRKKALKRSDRVRELVKEAREQNPDIKSLERIEKLIYSGASDTASYVVAPLKADTNLCVELRHQIDVCRAFIRDARREFHTIAVAAARETRGRNGGIYKGTRKIGNTLCGVSCVQRIAIGGGGADSEAPSISVCDSLIERLKPALAEKTSECADLTEAVRELTRQLKQNPDGELFSERLDRELVRYHNSCYNPLGELMRDLSRDVSAWTSLYRGMMADPLYQMQLPSSVMDTWGMPPHLCKDE